MELNNNGSISASTIRQRQQEQLQKNQQEQQQQHNEYQQQFCLRWHNHQASLLSTLPVLLDQCQLTDVTISAEGRNLRAHRVVLSACSSFFLEIFRTLDTTNHPVIIIPGASFAAIVALLNFMYSGEVNVYEEQIPTLLSLAETLGIKGLADVHNNLQKSTKAASELLSKSEKEDFQKSPSTPSSPSNSNNNQSSSVPLTNSLLNSATNSSHFNPLTGTKFPLPLENFFLKSLQFYPNLLPQPLNFSQTALNKTTEFLAKYQQQCNLYQGALGMANADNYSKVIANEETPPVKRFCSGDKKSQNEQSTPQKDIKRIDKIVESLRGGCGKSNSQEGTQNQGHMPAPLAPLSIKTGLDSYNSTTSPLMIAKQTPLFSMANTSQSPTSPHGHLNLNFNMANEDGLKCDAEKISTPPSPHATAPNGKPMANSKLYATCFICHKQLSNQYNLRVHLETHQNVRYACNVCSHVSRSKDALRKHVSYRHPGAPSPCETEARRKRATKLLNTTITSGSATMGTNNSSTVETSPNSPNISHVPAHFPTTATESLNAEAQSQLNAAAYMFLPNQFHLAAAAAAAAHQHNQLLTSKNSNSNLTMLDMQNSIGNNNNNKAMANTNTATTTTTTITTTTTTTTTAVPVTAVSELSKPLVNSTNSSSSSVTSSASLDSKENLHNASDSKTSSKVTP
ncbi:broad-complex core protein isoforms 1/2/3/4/5 [Glossina fuscipes]|uniref:Broad-complex core protein isoforms 1/2/3/4/5 n=1 Tax=Glossina fuscipes TaxID=7396 RepID=A0A8U0W3P9_9MUSC|nr:broad-complex core protein isoforms 1/2/3/4/5 [Glossina fuscipes]XP_037879808.1 broad-complex core protein isoforms 1/2/3/4/5 [Glossina fuscipes]